MGQQSPPEKIPTEILQTHLVQLHEKARVYLRQVWQMPFAYLATVGITFVQSSPEENRIASILIAGAYVILGLLIVQATRHIQLRLNSTIDELMKTERLLGIVPTVVPHGSKRMLPYYTIIGLGVTFNVFFLVLALRA